MKITAVKALHLRLPEVREVADGSQDCLIVRVHTAQKIEELAIDRIDGLADPLAAIAAIAVA